MEGGKAPQKAAFDPELRRWPDVGSSEEGASGSSELRKHQFLSVRWLPKGRLFSGVPRSAEGNQQDPAVAPCCPGGGLLRGGEERLKLKARLNYKAGVYFTGPPVSEEGDGSGQRNPFLSSPERNGITTCNG